MYLLTRYFLLFGKKWKNFQKSTCINFFIRVELMQSTFNRGGWILGSDKGLDNPSLGKTIAAKKRSWYSGF